ncbi:MAG: hypothetical protein AAFR79_04540 [Pseudomonadota bacterium]
MEDGIFDLRIRDRRGLRSVCESLELTGQDKEDAASSEIIDVLGEACFLKHPACSLQVAGAHGF